MSELAWIVAVQAAGLSGVIIGFLLGIIAAPPWPARRVPTVANTTPPTVAELRNTPARTREL